MTSLHNHHRIPLVFFSSTIFAFFLLYSCSCGCQASEIENLKQLVQAIEHGPNRKVAFISEGNYHSVHHILPTSTTDGGPLEVVIIPHEEHIIASVRNGSVLAGHLSGSPPAEKSFHSFSSSVVALHAFLLSRNYSATQDLIQAIDASIARLVDSGSLHRIIDSNSPFVALSALSCAPSPDHFLFPEESTATGFLSDVLSTKTLHVGALGPYDWGFDGNYTATPPAGFWPDYLDEITDQLSLHYEKNISLQRHFFPNSSRVGDSVYGNSVHLSEPYFIVSGFYNEVTRQEAFHISCTTLGYDTNFFTRSSKASNVSVIAIAVVVAVLVSVLIFFSVFVIYMGYRERKGRPIFPPLLSPTESYKAEL